ncbi:MAG: hypothetical protein KIH01_02605 [Candidatus Freyarchaeota archaeon]|nr:hypothetical protein [Candidatus Jordarchaeia archaeon]
MADFSPKDYVHVSLSERMLLTLKEKFGKENALYETAKFNRASREGYMTFSTNIFPKNRGDARRIYLEARGVVKAVIENHIGENGEIIEYEISEGRIFDGGRAWFYILEGFIVEAYCFTCKSVSFTRVLHELDPRKGAEWVSVDVDENADTPWFNES